MLTTSENNYKRSLFSFQQSCINQIVTQSIGIHLKRKIRVIKKTKTEKKPKRQKQISIQLKLERCHWLSTLGSKQLKSLRLHVLQGLRSREVCVVVSWVQIIAGRYSPPRASVFPPFSAVGRWCRTTSGKMTEDFNIVLSPTEVVPLSQKGCGRCKKEVRRQTHL